MPSSRESSWPRDQTQVSCVAGGFFTDWASSYLILVHVEVFRGSKRVYLGTPEKSLPLVSEQPLVVQSLSRVQLCDPMDCSTPSFPVLHHLPELAETHVHWVDDPIQPSHPLSSPSPPAFNLSQQQSLFQWVSSSYQVAKVLELQLQHQSFQWIFRTDFL